MTRVASHRRRSASGGRAATLERAARLLGQAIAASDPGGRVIAGSEEERIFDRAHGGAAEAAEGAHFRLQRAEEIAEGIEDNLRS